MSGHAALSHADLQLFVHRCVIVVQRHKNFLPKFCKSFFLFICLHNFKRPHSVTSTNMENEENIKRAASNLRKMCPLIPT